jgi:hypothetical protein
MRRLSILFVLLLVLAACTTTTDDTDTEGDEPTPAPTEEIVDEEQPEPTPTPTAEPTQEPTPEPTPTPEPEDEASIDLDAFVDEVVENVVELRGLEMIEELQFALMSRDELTEMLEEEVEVTQDDIDLYWIFRLLDDRDLDLERLMIDVQAADIYGFYDPETKETYVIAEDEELGPLEEVFLAHEITHALQDQHFDLGRLDEEDDNDYDAMTAFLAMVEGDAVLTQELYAQAYFDSEQQMEYMQAAMAAVEDEAANEAIEALPRYVIESLSFPYGTGAMFMLQVYDGTLNALDEHLENPPVSTQQVMRPDLYLAGEIPDPVEVEIPDMRDRLGDDWELYDEGTFGVFDLTIMLEENGVQNPDETMLLWTGSMFAAYENDEDVVGILSTEWESEEAAAEFEALLIETMADYTEEEGVWMGDGRFHTIIVEGTNVTLKSASDEEALYSVAQLNQ